MLLSKCGLSCENPSVLRKLFSVKNEKIEISSLKYFEDKFDLDEQENII